MQKGEKFWERHSFFKEKLCARTATRKQWAMKPLQEENPAKEDGGSWQLCKVQGQARAGRGVIKKPGSKKLISLKGS